jgi:hypothetical protein
MNVATESIIAHACYSTVKLKLTKLIIILPMCLKKKESNSLVGQLVAAQLNKLDKSLRQ